MAKVTKTTNTVVALKPGDMVTVKIAGDVELHLRAERFPEGWGLAGHSTDALGNEIRVTLPLTGMDALHVTPELR